MAKIRVIKEQCLTYASTPRNDCINFMIKYQMIRCEMWCKKLRQNYNKLITISFQVNPNFSICDTYSFLVGSSRRASIFLMMQRITGSWSKNAAWWIGAQPSSSVAIRLAKFAIRHDTAVSAPDRAARCKGVGPEISKKCQVTFGNISF